MTDKTPAPVKAAPQEAQASDETTERDSRIVSNALANGYKELTGQEANNDQLEALSELSLKLLKALRGVSYGGFFGGTIVALCLAVPFVVPMVKFFKSATKEENQNA